MIKGLTFPLFTGGLGLVTGYITAQLHSSYEYRVLRLQGDLPIR